jgi:trigger factor
MPTTALETTAEQLEKDRVRLRVTVPEAALRPAIDAVYRRWAQSIKVPGFRKGKIPRQLIDTRVGPETIREEALRDALPDLYREAVDAERLEVIAPPDIEVLEFASGAPLIFEATVDLRPEVPLPDFSSLEVQAPPSEVTDADVDEQLERLRDRFAELEPVGREARRGDFVLIDLRGYHHDQPVEGASAEDLLYEIGSGQGPAPLDDELQGARPGAILKFNDRMPAGTGELSGQDVSFTVLVKEVKAKRLPPLDDELAKTVGEFDSLAELREDLRARLTPVKARLVEQQIGDLVLEEAVGALRLEPPEKLVDAELEHRLEHFGDELAKAGLSMTDYATASDKTELEIRSEMRAQAARSIRAELLLEEIARDQGMEVTEEELGREIALAAARAEKDPGEVAKQLVESGRVGAVAADIMRRKALEYLVGTVNVIGRPSVEDDGQPAEEESDHE